NPPDTRPRVRHFRERRFLEIGRARDRVHQVGDQIGAPLVNVLHLRPLLVDILLQAYQSIVSAAEKQGDNEGDEKSEDEAAAATDGKLVHNIDNLIRGNRSGKPRPSQSAIAQARAAKNAPPRIWNRDPTAQSERSWME